MNTYLNLSEDDMRITTIITNLIKKLNKDVDFITFKDTLIELDNIDCGGLSEYDEDKIADCYNLLYKKCKTQISHYILDNTQMSRGITFGEFMKFLQTLQY